MDDATATTKSTLYTSLFRELLTYMMEDRATSRSAHICCSAQEPPRVGDHATNIAEAAYYLETGQHLSAEAQQAPR